MLQSLFGDRDDDWGGQESIDSEAEPDDSSYAKFETEKGIDEGSLREEDAMVVDETTAPEAVNAATHVEPVVVPAQEVVQAAKPAPTQQLKDLFASRQEDGAKL